MALAAALIGLTGCGPQFDGAKRPDPVDVTASVTGADGKPLPANLAVVLDPIGDQLPSKLTAKTAGEFAGKAMPGKYTFYIAPAKGDGTPEGVPAKYTSASMDNAIEVAAGQKLDLKLTK
jgi:hypothetical protein